MIELQQLAKELASMDEAFVRALYYSIKDQTTLSSKRRFHVERFLMLLNTERMNNAMSNRVKYNTIIMHLETKGDIIDTSPDDRLPGGHK